jgi:hypothetical protein
MIIRTDSDRNEFIARAVKIDLTKQVWRFEAKPYKPNRSAEQNRLAFMWYAELAKQSGNGKDYERNFCKWTYGCPILVEHDVNGFSAFYENLINRYDYEQCVASMDFIQVTSMFNVQQMSEYLKHMELYAGEKGYFLTKPVDVYHLAMGKEMESKYGKEG